MKVIIIGDGGHSQVIQEMVIRQGHAIIALLDDKYENEQIVDGKIIAPISYYKQLLDGNVKVVVAVGNNETRKKIVRRLQLSDEFFLTVVDPTAFVSSTALIGYGTVVMPNVVINANSVIKNHCIVNSGAVVEHDCRIEGFVHISPKATLTGNVSIGEGVHVGANATIIPSIKVLEWSIIGAGTTVIDTIPPYCTAVGNPARLTTKL
ncbi:acetyltransferase [Bacillus spongiae]|uniref:Acetyltransferase n=1 Tax=Bacillus spongiae TaxID=2683610 RepID=A0ABU8HEM1_9BACI